MPCTYILRCGDNELYVGSTTNLQERLKRHYAGYASEFTHLHKPVELVYKEEFDRYQEAFIENVRYKAGQLQRRKR